MHIMSCQWVGIKALKHIRQSAKRSKARASGRTLHIPIANHTESYNKIQDKSEQFVVLDHHRDPNVYIMHSLNKKGPKRTVNRWQLFNLKKSQKDQITADPCIKGPRHEPKLKKVA